jgi:hypothetical protein
LTAPEPFLRRVYRETVWFTAVVALSLWLRGLATPIWGGLLGGAAVSLTTLVLYDIALRRTATAERSRTAPQRQASALVIAGVGCLQLPLLGAMMYLLVRKWGLSGPAIAVGVAMPGLVALLKITGRAWTRWAQTFRPEEGVRPPPDEPTGD